MKPHFFIAILVLIFPLVERLDAGICDYNIVESMPDGLDLKDPEKAQVIKTHESLLDMIKNSKKSLRIASFYWYLTAPAEFDGNDAVNPGKELMESLKEASARNVSLEVVLDGSQSRIENNKDDIEVLEKIGTVKYLNMTELVGGGVMHTKFMIADNETFYLGSSNFDWRSYTEIKEMGLTFKNCDILAQDLDKIFRAFMMMSGTGTVPDTFPDDYKTSINMKTPLKLKLRDSFDSGLYLAGSPPSFNGKNHKTGRTDDIEAVLHLIRSAKSRISISVMNYSPRMEFVWPKKYWPLIDDALREAATTRNVKVQLLFSNWTNTRKSEMAWYRSLNAIKANDFRGSISVKLFNVPVFNNYQRRIKFARVKHDKYMVTDGGVYLGTSNWTPDYFVNTVGVSLIIKPESTNSITVKNFQDIFDRDFDSAYADEL